MITSRREWLLTFTSGGVDWIASPPLTGRRSPTKHQASARRSSVEGYAFKAERFQGLTTPTLLLLGSESPAFLREATAAVAAALANHRLVVLPGQGHVTMDTAPGLFVDTVVEFLAQA